MTTKNKLEAYTKDPEGLAAGNRTLECALYYISQGWQILPLHTISNGKCTCGKNNCESAGKHPYEKLVPNGTKNATTNRQTIEQWFDGETQLNIGVCAGKESGLVLLDVDPEHGGSESLKKYPKITNTLEVTTGSGGTHFYFKHPQNKEVRNSAGKLGPGLDIRGHHGYVVAPPSMHLCGNEYRWAVDPRHVELAECPTWLLNSKVKKKTEPGSDIIPDGQRDNTLTSIAGKLRSQNFGYSSIYAVLQKENAARCKPPLHDTDLKRITKSVCNYEPSKSTDGPIIISLGNVKSRAIEWFWPNRFPVGKMCQIAGHPGVGKSFLSLYMASKVSTGGLWPDECSDYKNVAPKGTSVFLSFEDDTEDTVKPRLEKMGANCDRIKIIRAVRIKGENKFFDLTKHLTHLESAVCKLKDVRLVVIDPISVFLGPTDSHKNAEVRNAIDPLGELASRQRFCLVCINHLNKRLDTSSPLEKLQGSMGFAASARTIWAVVRDKDDSTGCRRVFTPIKMNVAEMPDSLAYDLKGGKVNFEPRGFRADADALLNNKEDTIKPIETAKNFLKEELNGGPVLSKDVYRNAKDCAISERTLKRAITELEIVSTKQDFHGRWSMRLPEKLLYK